MLRTGIKIRQRALSWKVGYSVSHSRRGYGQKDKAKGKELWNILKAKAILQSIIYAQLYTLSPNKTL